MAIQILRLAITQIFQNWRLTIQICWLWATMGAIAFALMDWVPKRTWAMVAVALTLLAATVVGHLAVAIAWHRYLLRGERVSNAYFLRRDWPNDAFIAAAIKLWLVCLLVVIPVAGLVAFVLSPMATALIDANGIPSGPAKWLVELAAELTVATLVGLLFFRLGLALPAKAVSVDLGLRQSYVVTSSISGDLLKLAFFSAILSAVADDISELLRSLPAGPIATLTTTGFFVAVSWFTTFLGIGVLTILYGHLVEGRDI